MPKAVPDAWQALLAARRAEWDRLAAEAEDARQARLNALYPASEGWIGSEGRRGYRIRARQPNRPADDRGAGI